MTPERELRQEDYAASAEVARRWAEEPHLRRKLAALLAESRARPRSTPISTEEFLAQTEEYVI